MKKHISVLLTFLLAGSLAACGSSGSTSNTATTATSATTETVQETTTATATGWVPEKDIEFIIPFGTGGGNDVMVRKLIQIIKDKNLCPVEIVPVNKSGGSGVVGYTYLKEKGEGYAYSLASTSASFFTQPLLGNSPYTPTTKDFSFVAHMVKDPVVIIASKDTGFTSLDDIKEYCTAHPGDLMWGGVGTASDDAIIMYMLNDALGTDLTYVPYDDGGLLHAAILGGHIQMSTVSLAECIEYMEDGSMVALAACSDERLPGLNDIPTVGELGYDIAHQQSRGIVMNQGVSEEIRAYYSDLFQKVSETDEWKDFTKTNGMSNIFMNYSGYESYVNEMYEDYSKYLELIQKNS